MNSTGNIVPRSDGNGTLGVLSKHWGNVLTKKVNGSEIKELPEIGAIPKAGADGKLNDAWIGGPKAPENHQHQTEDIQGLDTLLSLKSDAGHGHEIEQVNALQSALDSKAGIVHSHTLDDTAGLTDALAGKSPVGHTHTANEVTGLSAVPSGVIMAYAGGTAPDGWLVCNGAAVSRTTYASLFAAIGTTYGAGNDSTTFNLPDLRGEFIRGLDRGRGVDSGRTLGSAQESANLSHNHGGSTNSTGSHNHFASTNTTGNHSHVGYTDEGGNHRHTYYYHSLEQGSTIWSSGGGLNVAGRTDHTGWGGHHGHTIATNSNGNHSHTVTVNNNGSHSHTISNAGGNEARPRNIAMDYIIKI